MQVSVRPISMASPRTAVETPPPGDAEPPEDNTIYSTFKKGVNLTACAADGTVGGYLAGALGGRLLTNMTALPMYSQFGPIGGAATGLLVGTAFYLRNNDDAISQTIKAAAGGSVGATAGLFAGAHFGPALASVTANALYESVPLASTLSGALMGAALTRWNHDDTGSDVLKQAAFASVGGTAGWMLGGLSSHAVSALTDHAFNLGGTLGAVFGVTAGLALYLNADKWVKEHLEQSA
ncbi:MAG: hypothetical protein HY319_13245 [Armatimonadetes bacterium]|nr:hypothetical protein [Armatimonadota bacterium]